MAADPRPERVPSRRRDGAAGRADSHLAVNPPARGPFVALRHRNFRLIWIGLLVSFTGTFMQNAALLWHVSLLVAHDKKALALGLVGLTRVVPIIVFSLVSGVVADAWDRRRLMLFTQASSAVVALTLALLAFGGLASVWPLYALAALGSAVGAFDLRRARRSCPCWSHASTCRTRSA